MSSRLYSRSLDANHKQIVERLEAHGIFVYDMSKAGDGFVDLITHHVGFVGFLEVKVEGSSAKFKRGQLFFMAHSPFNVGVVRNEEEALRFAKNPSKFGLTIYQKNRLAVFLERYPKQKEFSVNTIQRVIDGEQVTLKTDKTK